MQEGKIRWADQENEKMLTIDSDDRDCDCNDDDKRSISSESTCCDGAKAELQMRQKQFHFQSTDFEIWRLFEIDNQSMKDVPNAEKLLDILTLGNLDGKLSIYVYLHLCFQFKPLMLVLCLCLFIIFYYILCNKRLCLVQMMWTVLCCYQCLWVVATLFIVF